jgi:hypothetical protein
MHTAIFFTGKPEWKRPLRKLRPKCEDNIRMDFEENGVGMCGLDAPDPGHRPVSSLYVNTVMNHRIP